MFSQTLNSSNSNVLSEVASISVGAKRPQEHASVPQRFLAFCIDMAVVAPLPIFFILLLFTVPVPPGARGESFVIAIITGIILLLLVFSYFVYFETSSGQTLGKRALHIRVTDRDGGSIYMSASLIRTLILVFDAFLLLGVFFMLFSKRHQRVGDMLASTVVVKYSVKSQYL